MPTAVQSSLPSNRVASSGTERASEPTPMRLRVLVFATKAPLLFVRLGGVASSSCNHRAQSSLVAEWEDRSRQPMHITWVKPSHGMAESLIGCVRRS